MPHKDPEARRRYLLANKDRIAARQKAYYRANQEKLRQQANAHAVTYKERRKEIDAKPEHKARRRAYARQWQLDNPDKVKERNKRTKPTRAATEPSSYRNRALLIGRPRPDLCEICSMATKRIVLDHCHALGHPRGWVCERCNHALGMVQDSIPHLLKLIAYLERNRVNTSPQFTLSGI